MSTSKLAGRPALDHLAARLDERDLDLAYVAARPVPVRVRGQERVLVVELGQRERAVGDDVLRAVPVLTEQLAAVPRPGKGPRRGEDVREKAARLAQGDLERAVVECLGGLDVLHEERGPRLQLAHPHPGEGEVVRGQRLAVAPAHVLAQAEEVRETVARDAHVVRHRREDVQLGVDHEQALEELLGDLQALGRVDVAGDDGVGLRDRRRRGARSARGAAPRRRGSENASSYISSALSKSKARW